MTFASPLWLLAWPALAAIALAVGARRQPVPWRDVAFGLAVAAAIVIALAGPSLPGAHNSRHVTLIIDMSPSQDVRIDAPARRQLVEDVPAQLRPGDTFSVVELTMGPRVLIDTAGVDGEPLGLLDGPDVADAGTDLASALWLALERRPSGSPTVFRLVTDGRHTGDPAELDRARMAVAAAGIPVETVVLAPRDIANVGFSRIIAPPWIAPGRRWVVQATIRSTGPQPVRTAITVSRNRYDLPAARVTLRIGEQPALPDRDGAWTLPPGFPCTVRVDLPAEDSGFVAIGLDLRVLGDPAANRVDADDRILAGTVVRSRRVLAITRDGTDESANFIRLLRRERPDLDLQLVAAPDAPHRTADYLGYAAVILDSVRRDSLPRADATDRAIAEAVERFGVGLIMAGSRDSFGPGGWIDSRVDDVLPVDCDPNRDVGAAVVLALDVSGSMSEGAKTPTMARASRRLLEQCTDRDSLAVVTFDRAAADRPIGDATFASVNADSIARTHALLDQLVAGAGAGVNRAGETNLFAPIERGVELLSARDDDAKLLLCLTDGEPTFGPRTFDDNSPWPALLARAAKANAFVAVISTEPIRPGSFLSALQARLPAGTGSVQSVADLAQLPREFVDRLADARGPLMAPAQPGGWPVHLGDARRPTPHALLGYARTKPKRDVEVTVPAWLADDEPLLASRVVGVGRSAAVMLPLDDAGLLGDDWLRAVISGPSTTDQQTVWREMLAMIDAATAAPPVAPLHAGIEETADGRPLLVVRVDPERTDATTRAQWVAAGGIELRLQGDETVHTIPPVTPGRYELPLDDRMATGGLLIGQLRAPTGGAVQPVALTLPLHREWRDLSHDDAVLDALATLPTRTTVEWLDQQAPPAGEPVDLAGWFALLAIVLIVAREAIRVWHHLAAN